MARDTRAAFLRALAEVEPQIERAFREAIQDVRSSAQARVIQEAIRRAVDTGDIARGVREVVAALQLGEAFFAPLDRSILTAFEAGAQYQLSLNPRRLPGVGRLEVRFQGRHVRAEAWTRERAASLITEIGRDQETLIRNLISEAVAESRPYRTVTRQLLGEIVGNQRVGGLIGLHSRQAAAVEAARAQMAELDPRVLQRQRLNGNDRRRLAKAIREGRRLDRGEIDDISRRYADRLLRLRAETIARTEGNKAMNAGRVESVQQMIDGGRIRADLVTKVWRATMDSRTRDPHRLLNGTEVRWNEGFISPATGYPLRYPHDELAPGADTVNCRCTMWIRINWAAMADGQRLAA